MHGQLQLRRAPFEPPLREGIPFSSDAAHASLERDAGGTFPVRCGAPEERHSRAALVETVSIAL